MAKDVLRAQRPSSANNLTHRMFCSCDVNGAATENDFIIHELHMSLRRENLYTGC